MERGVSGLFITGTDTGVGKTWVSRALLHAAWQAGEQAGAYKPLCSGARPTDAGFVWDDEELLASELPLAWREYVCSQKFLAPLAPPVAAALEGRAVDWSRLLADWNAWCERTSIMLVEGAGGWYCPLDASRSFADLAVEIGLPVLVVARAGLGTINHTLLTVEAISRRKLPIAGVVLNASEETPIELAESNTQELRRRLSVPVWGWIAHGSTEVLSVGPASQLHCAPSGSSSLWEISPLSP